MASRWTSGPTSGRSGACSTKCSRAARRSRATRSPTRSPRFSSASRTGRRCRPPPRRAFGVCCSGVSTKMPRGGSATSATRALTSMTRWTLEGRSGRPAYLAVGLLVVALLLLAGGVGLFYSAKPSAPVTSPSEYTQITNFTDSAVAPSLSPDGRMVTFIRGGDSFLSRGQIYVKLLPNGESVRLTNDARAKYAPVFTPDGSRIAYTDVSAWLGYLDGSGARGPADAAPAQRLRPHLDHRSSGAVFRDQDRPPHGDCDRDGEPGGLARDLFSAERARDGALLLRVTGPSVGSCRRDERHPRV